jgi:hypothetical protein
MVTLEYFYNDRSGGINLVIDLVVTLEYFYNDMFGNLDIDLALS